jgi:hypothetical protein
MFVTIAQFTYLEDGTGTMHLQFLVLAFQIPHEIFNHALSANGKSITLLKSIENLFYFRQSYYVRYNIWYDVIYGTVWYDIWYCVV